MKNSSLISIVLLVCGLHAGVAFPNIRVALELLNSFESRNTGNYLKDNVMKQAIVPALNLLGQHILALEKRETHQETWLTVVTVFFGSAMGLVVIIFIVKRTVMNREVRGNATA